METPEPVGKECASSRDQGLEAEEGQASATAFSPELFAYAEAEEHCRRCRAGIANTAHDLRTPLTILLGYVELLLSGKAGPLKRRQRAILEEVNASANRLHRLTQDFLAYSSLRVAKPQLNREVADLNACLSELSGIWAGQFQKKGIAFYFLPSEELKPFAFDYYKVQHVASNLLENALKYTPEGGSVWLHVEPYFWNRRLGPEPAKTTGEPNAPERRKADKSGTNAAKVTVSDTGPGIAPERHLEIFSGYRELAMTDEDAKSVGLGLAIALRLVEIQGGKIWVESDVGTGSKFCFLLPFLFEASRE